jgi:hypothetical protein
MNEQSMCSNVVCVVSTELYGSTTEEENRGAWFTQNSSFNFLSLSIERRSRERACTKTGSSAAAEGVEDKEALEATAVICESANFVHRRRYTPFQRNNYRVHLQEETLTWGLSLARRNRHGRKL